MGKNKRAKKKDAKKRNEDLDKMNGGVKQKIYKHHKQKDCLKINQNKEIFNKHHNESEKFNQLCNHDKLKGAILEEDLTFTKFDFDVDNNNKRLDGEIENNRVENLYNIALNKQSNSTTKYQVYKKEKKSDQTKAEQGYKTLEKDIEYDFETFIPQ